MLENFGSPLKVDNDAAKFAVDRGTSIAANCFSASEIGMPSFVTVVLLAINLS